MTTIDPVSMTDALLYTAVLLNVVGEDGSTGQGTAFFYQLRAEEQDYVFLVTNRHVVEGCHSVAIVVHCGDKVASADRPTMPNGTTLQIETVNAGVAWSLHPEFDLAIMPMGKLLLDAEKNGTCVMYRALREEAIPDDAALRSLTTVENVLMLGFPRGLWDDVNCYPLFRRGITATHPLLDYGGEPVGVVDIACFHGSSGSPIMIAEPGAISFSDGAMVRGSRFYLLGLLASAPTFSVDGEIVIRDVPTALKPAARPTDALPS